MISPVAAAKPVRRAAPFAIDLVKQASNSRFFDSGCRHPLLGHQLLPVSFEHGHQVSGAIGRAVINQDELLAKATFKLDVEDSGQDCQNSLALVIDRNDDG